MASNEALFPWASRKRMYPCELDGVCPYASETGSACEYWCPPDDEPCTEEENYLDP